MISWKRKGDYQKARNFCNIAIELLLLTKEDPKNKHGVEELNSLVEELRDYFLENNINGTTDEVLMRTIVHFCERE